MTCMCEWDSACSGLGTIYCLGCGGDQCVCRCGGETDCPGCENCEGDEYAEPFDVLGHDYQDEPEGMS